MLTLKTKSFDAAPGQMKVWKARLVESGPEVTLVRVPISSTTEDRDGDEFSLWEVSAVGIPSNPDTANSAATAERIKSLRIKAGLETADMKRKTKETDEEQSEEEQEEEKQPESCEEQEEKAPEKEPEDEEVGKALAPIAEALKSLAVLDEIKTTVTKAVAIKKPDGSTGTTQTVYWRAEV